MKKAINTKTKKINVIYGFFNDNNYGVDYPTLMDSIDMTDLFPYINKGETEIKDCDLLYALWKSCRNLECNPVIERGIYTCYVDVKPSRFVPTLAVTFRIVENAA